MLYEITIHNDEYAIVTRPGYGYCEKFFGRNYKADAIRYVLQRRGKFVFKTYKYEVIGQK